MRVKPHPSKAAVDAPKSFARWTFWLAASWLAAGFPASASETPGDGEYIFPPDAHIVDVRRDFGAKGDGVTDDTRAIQDAVIRVLDGKMPGGRYTPAFVYLPNGTYLVSDTIRNRIGEGGWGDGWRVAMILVGQTRTGAVIRLKDDCPGFTDPARPKAVLMYGSEMHGGRQNDRRPDGYGNCAFRNAAINLTVDIGKGNAGAIGIDFLASNKGAVRQVTIRSSDPDLAGHTGLSQVRAWPGPGLIKDVEIIGFDWGIRQKSMDCSMTYQSVTLRGQRKAAIEALESPTMSLRGIRSENAVPVAQIGGNHGLIMFLDSTFTWTGRGEPPPAITNQGNLLLKGVDVRGYPKVVVNTGEKMRPVLTLEGGTGRVDQYLSRDPLRLFPGGENLPNLPVKDAPTYHTTDLSRWANPARFARGSRTAGIQEAIDSGAEIVYLPNGTYTISETIVLRGSVRKLLGLEAAIKPADGVKLDPAIRLDDGGADVVMIEHIKALGRRGAAERVVEHNSARSLVIRHCEVGYRNTARGTGDVFFEDNMLGQPRFAFPQNAWAWQLNSEFGAEPQLVNNGGNLWVLGMKTEGNTELVVNNKGVVEVYALYDMTTAQPDAATAMVVNNEGRMAVSFADGGQKSHKTKIRETRDGQTRTASGPRETMMYIGGR